MNPDTNEIHGWARACAATSGGTCSSMSTHTEAGSWDGWISMNCANTGDCSSVDYSVGSSNGLLSGYAWGGDVVGWINFSDGYYTPPCTASWQCSLTDATIQEETDQWCQIIEHSCSVGKVCSTNNPIFCIDPAPPTGDIDLSQSIVRSGSITDVTWTSGNASDCNLEQENYGGTSIATWNGLSGSETSEPIEYETVFNLYCYDEAGANYQSVATAVVRLATGVLEI